MLKKLLFNLLINALLFLTLTNHTFAEMISHLGQQEMQEKEAFIPLVDGEVIRIDENSRVFIAKREDNTILQNMNVLIFKLGDYIRHPVTKEVMAIEEIPSALVKIISDKGDVAEGIIVREFVKASIGKGYKVRKMDDKVYLGEREKIIIFSNFIDKGLKVIAYGYKSPRRLEVDREGNIYLLDTKDSKISKYDIDGNRIKIIGKPGSNNGSFKLPMDIALDSKENIYVADTYNKRIQKLDNAGKFISAWPGTGDSKDCEFEFVTGIAVDSKDFIYTVDKGINRICKFDNTGKFIKKWGEKGNKQGQFLQPEGLTIDYRDILYVADSGANRVQRFSPDGVFIDMIADSLKLPSDIDIDIYGNIYIVDTGNQQIQVFDQNLKFLWKVGGDIKDVGRLLLPYGIKLSKNGELIIADTGNYRLQALELW